MSIDELRVKRIGPIATELEVSADKSISHRAAIVAAGVAFAIG